MASSSLFLRRLILPWQPLIALGAKRIQISDVAFADAIVVLGARVYSDGRPSRSLTDRLTTAVELYQHGRASTLVLSGGPGDGAVHETDAMRTFAEGHGVSATSILIDRGGTSTRGTAVTTARYFHSLGWKHVLIVTHDWHLPRSVYEMRRLDVHATGVPARNSVLLSKRAYLVAREVVACWRTAVTT